MKLLLVGLLCFTLTACNENKEPSIDLKDKVNVVMNVSNYGEVTIELDPSIAPITVENFVNLVNDGFYDGLTFHRVITGFMVQGGDPSANGTGGSGVNIKGEFNSNGIQNNLSHTRGVISMARSNDPNSASSQFFIMHQDSPHLDGNYAAFGKVTNGIEIIDEICNDSIVEDGNGTVAKENQIKIESIKIIQ